DRKGPGQENEKTNRLSNNSKGTGCSHPIYIDHQIIATGSKMFCFDLEITLLCGRPGMFKSDRTTCSVENSKMYLLRFFGQIEFKVQYIASRIRINLRPDRLQSGIHILHGDRPGSN